MPATLSPARGVRVSDVLPNSQVHGSSDVRVTSCCSDPAHCREGDLFIAVCGDQIDGHDFVYEAIDRGAVAVVAERMLPVQVPLFLVDDTREANGAICQALLDNPTREMTTIGVTGTHGKTTVVKLLASVLRAAGQRVGVINSLECCDGIVSYDGPRPTASTELAHWMAEMQAAGCTHAIVEVDSDDLAKRRCTGLEFNATVLTNVRTEGLGKHQSQNYRSATKRIFSQLKEGGFAVVNADDRASRNVLGQLECPTLSVGQNADAEISAMVIERFASEQTILISAGDETIPLRTHKIGDTHVSNCLLVTATALGMGIDLPTIVRGLEAVECIPNRMERIECGQPFGVFLDVADTPDRLAAALKTLRQLRQGRVICIAKADIANASLRPLLGRVLERYSDIGLTTVNNKSDERSLHTVHDVIDGYERPAKAHAIIDRQQAIAWALEQAQPGDCVLITGCRDEHALPKNAQSDALTVRELLREEMADDIEQMILRIHEA